MAKAGYVLFDFYSYSNLVSKISREQNVEYIPTKNEIQKLFNQFDKDKSGKLDEKEFLLFTKMVLKELIEANKAKK